MFRRFAYGLAIGAVVVLAGCHGGGGLPGTDGGSAGEPRGLQYEQPVVTYRVGRAIPPNLPRSTGAPIDRYSVAPSLPAGLALDADSGVISGTPTDERLQTTYTVTGSNAVGATTAVVTLAVTATLQLPVRLNYEVQSADYLVGTPIPPNAPHPVGGAVTHYSADTPLPPGLVLSATTGVISGTPLPIAGDVAMHYDVTVTGSNDAGSAQEDLTIDIAPETAPPVPPRNFHYDVSWAAYGVGEAIAANDAHHDGGEIVGYSVAPTLPTGLTLDPTTGDISGVPTAASPSTKYEVTGVGAAGSGNVVTSVTLEVVPPGTWVPTPGAMQTTRYDGIQVTLPDGRVLVAGGADGSGSGDVLASAELYNPATGEWTPASPMLTARRTPMRVLLPSGKLLVAGGTNSTGVLDSAEIFDPSNPNAPWQSTTGKMKNARVGAAMAILSNGNVVVAGGDRTGAGSFTRGVEIYDVASRTWADGIALNKAVFNVSALSMQGGAQIVVPGGVSLLGAVSNQAQASSDPASGLWANQTLAGTARSQYAAIAMDGNFGLVLGGLNGTSKTDVDLYNAQTRMWSSLTRLTGARSGALVAPLSATQVLVAGGTAGTSGGMGIQTAEVYTFDPLLSPPSADAPTSPMSRIRIGAGISTLYDGHVLVSGGLDNTNGTVTYTNTSELYVP